MIRSPKILVGASIPRSGHHFLQTLLTRLFGPDMHYCEFYSPQDCCRQMPCTRRGAFPLIFQKSHDREMEVPKTLANAVYVLQYRHPVPEALSDRELDLLDGFGRISLAYRQSREHYAQWLAAKAVYYRRYHDKWMADRLPNAVYLDYQDLLDNPADAVEQVVRAATGEADRARIEAVVAESKSVRVSAGGGTPRAFRPRVVQDSPHFDADLLGAFEDYVVSRAPRFGYARMLDGRFEGHALQGLILALDETEPLPHGHADRLEAAMALAGEHPDLLIRLARREARAGRHEEALRQLRRVVERHPYCTQAWPHLFAACRALGLTPPAEVFGGDALLGLAGRPELLPDAGKALLNAGQVVSAIAALSLAVTLNAGNAKAHHLLAHALLRANRPQQAVPHAEEAARMEPGNPVHDRLLTTARKRLPARRAA